MYERSSIKNRKTINFKFHFIIYRDLNVTGLSKRFPTIDIRTDEVQHGIECVLSRITLCSR